MKVLEVVRVEEKGQPFERFSIYDKVIEDETHAYFLAADVERAIDILRVIHPDVPSYACLLYTSPSPRDRG